MKRMATLCVLVMTLVSLSVSACASSTAARPPVVPTATHVPTATSTPVPPPVNAYLGAGGTVYALDGRTGARLWTYDAHNLVGNLALPSSSPPPRRTTHGIRPCTR